MNITQASGRVRIARISAADRGEPGFAEARTALAHLIAGHQVRCQQVDADPRAIGVQRLDRFERIVAHCEAGGQQLGPAMIASGQAVKWPKKRG